MALALITKFPFMSMRHSHPVPLFITSPSSLRVVFIPYLTHITTFTPFIPHMWPPWLSAPRRRIQTTTPQPQSPPPPSRSRSSRFSCTSFKDIHTLLQPEPEPEPTSPKSPSLFRRSTSLIRSFSGTSTRTVPSSCSLIFPPYSDQNAIVVYYTSLRIVRRTFDDCRAVRSILRGFGVAIDERDVSIYDRFRDELREILGRWNVTLPCVFVGGKYIGGADDVRRIYDSGELHGLIERLPMSESNACDLCGGLRFVVCEECDGSHKVFTDKSGFRSCSSCNANGLIRCPACFFVLPRHTK